MAAAGAGFLLHCCPVAAAESCWGGSWVLQVGLSQLPRPLLQYVVPQIIFHVFKYSNRCLERPDPTPPALPGPKEHAGAVSASSPFTPAPFFRLFLISFYEPKDKPENQV